MHVSRFCTSRVVTAPQSANLADIARSMRDENVGTVVILAQQTDRTVPIGIITDRDIVRAQLEHAEDLAGLAARGVMTADPLMLREDTSFNDALEQMARRGVRRAPVVNARGDLVGVVSVDDLIAQVARQLNGLSRLLALQPMIERLTASPG